MAGLSFADPRVAIAAAMVPLVVGAALLVPWERFPAWPQAILPLSYFVILALLREAGGGTPSVFDPLLSIPIISRSTGPAGSSPCRSWRWASLSFCRWSSRGTPGTTASSFSG
jgi:hypothetical protein